MNDMQTMIADSAARLFSDQCDKALLTRFDGGARAQALAGLVADSGFDRVMMDESQGGAGGGWAEAWPILRAMGYWQVPLPLAETVVAGGLMARAGLSRPPRAEGAIALIEDGRHASLSLRGEGGTGSGGLRIHGRAQAVAWARDSRWLLVAIGSPRRLALVDLAGAGVQMTPGANIAAEPRDDLTLDGAAVVSIADAPASFGDEPVWVAGALARCAAIVGGLEYLLEQSVQYANDRVQFGKPIAKYQAVQHALAELAGEAGAARMAARTAFDAADAGAASLRFDVAAAKTICGEAATAACGIAHQVHGAIGFTQEHALHFATRRLWSWRADFGSDASWAEELGQAAIAAGGQGFWPALTSRTLAMPRSE